MKSPWLEIPLEDYEGHMSLPSIGQAEALSTLFAELLEEFRPSSVAVIGCAGGNGFDRILSSRTPRVVGIDINPIYVQTLSARYADKIDGLELHVADVQLAPLPFEPVDLIYAALVFEYVEPLKTLCSLKSVCKPGGVLATVLQLPSSTLAPVSKSPYISLQSLSPVINLLTPSRLSNLATENGFIPLSERQIGLPSGKKFAVQIHRAASAS